MTQRTQIRRISEKRLREEFGGKMPSSTISRSKFPHGKPRSTRGSSTKRKAGSSVLNRKIRLAKHPAAGLQPKSGRRVKLFPKPPILIRRDGKEICNLKTSLGRASYRGRIDRMVIRQEYLCCNCREPLVMKHATFEHENGRGAGKRDDRIEVDGKPINGASHGICNVLRGSKRTPIWHGPQERIA